MSVSVRDILKEEAIEASAPCRIDSGGTWDIRAMALPCEYIRPATVNMALNLRSKVTLAPFRDHRIRVSSEGFSRSQVFHEDHIPFDSPFGIFLAAVSFFNMHGIHVHITSASPVKSAMGGSSTALIALLKALDKLRVLQGKTSLDTRRLLHLGYFLEDGISGGNCGIQDQAAATYGGVNLWTWQYSNPRIPFKREPLLKAKEQRILSEHLAVAYSGKSHVSARTNRKWIKDFLSGKTRKGWIEVNAIVRAFARELQAMRWAGAVRLLRREMALRREITPEALTPITDVLIGQAEKTGCGARFTGAGAGGTVWAIGETENIEKLKVQWKKILAPVRGAKVLDCGIDNTGVR